MLRERTIQTLVKMYNIWLTFASYVRPKPLSSVIVKEALCMGEPHGQVSRVAGVLEDSLQGEGYDVWSTIVSCMLHHWRICAEH